MAQVDAFSKELLSGNHDRRVVIVNGLITNPATYFPLGTIVYDRETRRFYSVGQLGYSVLPGFEYPDVPGGLATLDELGFLTASQDPTEILSVKRYGAIGDGVTNDTTALVNAFAAAALTGGTVFFPAGVYQCDPDALTIPTLGIGIVGEGLERTKIRARSAGTAMLSRLVADGADKPAGVIIRDLQIDCAFQAASGLIAERGREWRVSNLEVKHPAAGPGIRLGYVGGADVESYGHYFDDVRVDCGRAAAIAGTSAANGFETRSGATDCTFVALKVAYAKDVGIFNNAGNNRFISPHVFGGTAVGFDNRSASTITAAAWDTVGIGLDNYARVALFGGKCWQNTTAPAEFQSATASALRTSVVPVYVVGMFCQDISADLATAAFPATGSYMQFMHNNVATKRVEHPVYVTETGGLEVYDRKDGTFAEGELRSQFAFRSHDSSGSKQGDVRASLGLRAANTFGSAWELGLYTAQAGAAPTLAARSTIQGDFEPTRGIIFPALSGAPGVSFAGLVVRANRTSWDPLSKASGGSYLVMRNDADDDWVAIDAQGG